MLNATNVFAGLLDLFQNIGNLFIEKIGAIYQPSANLFYIALAAFVIYLTVVLLRTSSSYEIRLIKAVDRLNLYFYNNPQINEDNLIEFNNEMKNVPKAVRTQWQLFMLNRDKPASTYLNLENCIDRPMKTTTYKDSIRTINIIFDIFIVLLFIVSFAGLASSLGDNQLGLIFYYSFVMPFLIYVLKSVLMIFLHIRLASTVSDLYNNFNIFQRGLDKATITLPSYIDYEVLFTKKEIKSSIPILQDYIEKRERLEKEELERAREAQVEHEKYDFSSVGFDASILLDRIAKECEIYLNNKKRLNFEVGQIEEEMRILTINFEEKSKDNIKQQQLCRENLQRLRLSAETSTSRVSANNVKKQQESELKRQEELEKEMRRIQEEYEKQLEQLKSKVANRESDQTNKKKNIEFAVISEFRTYADKIYKHLEDTAEKAQKEKFDKIVEEKEAVEAELKQTYVSVEDKERQLVELQNAIQAKDLEIQAREQEVAIKTETIDKITGELNETIKSEKKKDKKSKEPQYDANGGYYDEQGYYRYKDGGYYTPDGKYFDANGNYIPTETEIKEEDVQPEVEGVKIDKEPEVNTTEAIIENKKEEGRVKEAKAKTKKVKVDTSKEKDEEVKKEKSTSKVKTAKKEGATKKAKAETTKKADAKTTDKKANTKATDKKVEKVESKPKDKTKKVEKKAKITTSKKPKKKDELEQLNDEIEKANKELLENHKDLKSTIDSTDIE